jgi:predicted DNA-binding protein
MIAIPHDLEQPFLEMAKREHKSPSELLAQLLAEILEDYHDARLAEQAIKDIESGKDKVISLVEARKMFNELVS